MRSLPKRFLEEDFVFTISCLVALIFLAVFFLHPSKAAHLLAVVPFLLLVAAGRSLALLLARRCQPRLVPASPPRIAERRLNIVEMRSFVTRPGQC